MRMKKSRGQPHFDSARLRILPASAIHPLPHPMLPRRPATRVPSSNVRILAENDGTESCSLR
jgi:hypothetical protein